VNEIIARNQITEGGPVILVQAENEYSVWTDGFTEDFDYEARLLQDFVCARLLHIQATNLTELWQRDTGIVVPITINDAFPGGHFTSGDIYGWFYPQCCFARLHLTATYRL
jgi:hypothetical protein